MRYSGYGLNSQVIRVQFLAAVTDFPVLHSIQIDSEVHPASYPMITKGSFWGGSEQGMKAFPPAITAFNVLNKLAQSVLLLTCIYEVPCSNLVDWGNDYSEKFFMVFLSPSWQILGQYLKLGHHNFLPRHFQFIMILSFDMTQSETLTVAFI
jgi:hypothetical protein